MFQSNSGSSRIQIRDLLRWITCASVLDTGGQILASPVLHLDGVNFLLCAPSNFGHPVHSHRKNFNGTPQHHRTPKIQSTAVAKRIKVSKTSCSHAGDSRISFFYLSTALQSINSVDYSC